MYPQLRFKSLPPMKLTGIAPGFRTTHVKEFFPGISCKLSPCSDHISYAIPHLVFFPYKIVDGNGGTTSSTIRNNIVDVCALLVQCRICTKGQQSAFRFLDTRVVSSQSYCCLGSSIVLSRMQIFSNTAALLCSQF